MYGILTEQFDDVGDRQMPAPSLMRILTQSFAEKYHVIARTNVRITIERQIHMVYNG